MTHKTSKSIAPGISRLPIKVSGRTFLMLLTTGLFLGGVAHAATPPVTIKSLLEEMTDRDAQARWPQPSFTGRMASSYDRKSTAPDKPGWFENADNSQYIRHEEKDGRHEWVMMESDAPGAVVRIWTGGKEATGTVRFYLDGNDEPAIAMMFQDLVTGKAFVPRPLATETPKDSGNLFMPIPYAKHCKITYEEPNPNEPAKPPQRRWYCIEYRTYPAGTAVETFTMEGFEAIAATVQKTVETLTTMTPVRVERQAMLEGVIQPGKELSVDLPAGAAAVRQLEIQVGKSDANTLRTVILRAEFDGGETIWCPVGDFSGSGVGLNIIQSWTRSVTKSWTPSAHGLMTSRWVMPYAKSGRFTLLNLGQEPVSAKLVAGIGNWTWDDRSMHFNANWRQQRSMPVVARVGKDWNYVSIAGKGVYLGDNLCVYNPSVKWWGEGDEKITVDGESFPSYFGTGTEDYYGYAWGSPYLYQTPFLNQVRCDGPGNKGYTVVTRTRSLDVIPFTKSLNLDMEIWHWDSASMDYAATLYWYGVPGSTSNREPTPEEVRLGIPERP